jgi:Zn-dependent alcohol dehydrogenase
VGGHEGAGIVVEVGKFNYGVKVGDHVGIKVSMSDGGFMTDV